MGTPPKTRVVVGMSGGVDSAVAALRLVQEGHEVHGLFMENWVDDAPTEGETAYCTSAQDYQDARLTARELGIVLHRVSFATEYRERVFAQFLDEYRRGRTPNPDVLCNREIKFGVCRHYTQRLGADWFATGHYARLLHSPTDGQSSHEVPQLWRACDAAKDQSYFLCGVERAQFNRVRFPLGELGKPEVRDAARRAGLPVFDKADSTGICFIGERPFAQFLARYIPESPGPIETTQGQVLGTHRGLPFYTLGQRGGLEIGGVSGGHGDPWYVARKDPSRNALIVVPARERTDLRSTALRMGSVNWLQRPDSAVFKAAAKVRYRQADQEASVTVLDGGTARLDFAEPQWAVTPGQTAALYVGERCLGGGVIEETL